MKGYGWFKNLMAFRISGFKDRTLEGRKLCREGWFGFWL
jgi:hypothetical protein